METPENTQRHTATFAGIYARTTYAFSVILITGTLPLWIGSEFPAIPLLPGLTDVPVQVDWLLCAALGSALIAGLVLGNRKVSTVAVSIASCSLLLAFLNQHRLQPWLYQLVLTCIILAFAQASQQRKLLQYLMLSIYTFSAIGKFDYEFAHTVGPQFVSAICQVLSVELDAWPPERLWQVSQLLPTLELSLAAMLAAATLFPRKRLSVFASLGAVIFHLSLACIFCFLLRHSWGVIVWNLQFAAQAWLLFSTHDRQANAHPDSASKNTRPKLSTGSRFAISIVALAIGLPCLERFGYWDHWMSWSLYSPHSSRVDIAVGQPYVPNLPAVLREITITQKAESAAEDFGIWEPLPIEEWSLMTTGAPIVPQARFQLGVANSIANRTSNAFSVRVTLKSVAHRFTGKRENETAVGRREINRLSKRFWLNTTPRDLRIEERSQPDDD